MPRKKKVEELVVQHKLSVQQLLDGSYIIVDENGKPVNKYKYDEITVYDDVAIVKTDNDHRPYTMVVNLVNGFVLFNTSSKLCKRLDIDYDAGFAVGWNAKIKDGKRIVQCEAYGFKGPKGLQVVPHGPNDPRPAWRNVYMVYSPKGKWIDFEQEPFE